MKNTQSRPLIVMIHGWGFDTGVFKALSSLLEQDFRVQCIDLPGYADEAMIEDHSLDGLCESVLDQLHEPAIFVGWSMGGLIATKLAEKRPSLVENLVLMCSTPCFAKKPDWPHALSRSVLENFIQAYQQQPQSTLDKFGYLVTEGSENPRGWIRQLKQLSADVEPTALEQGLQILLQTDLRELLFDLQTRTLMIFAEFDSLVPITLEKAIRSLENPALSTGIVAAGHAPFLTHSAELAEQINEFITG